MFVVELYQNQNFKKMAELYTKSFDGRNLPAVNDNVLNKIKDEIVYDCADLRLMGNGLVCGRLKLKPSNCGWVPFVWNYLTEEIKLLLSVDGESLDNSIYIAPHDSVTVYGHFSFKGEEKKWYAFRWSITTGNVDYDVAKM